MSLKTACLWSDISVNRNVMDRVATLNKRAAELGVIPQRTKEGALLIDAGIHTRGSIDAGLLIAEICMGGLGTVRVNHSGASDWPLSLNVHTTHPVLACLGSQYAGWKLSHGEGKDAFFALGSGPARARACREDLFAELGYKDKECAGVLVLEVDKPPPDEILHKVIRDCDISPGQLTVILTPTQSMAGSLQVVARVLEVALHKAHVMGFDLDNIIDGVGYAPLAPTSPDAVIAMGRTNDAILFAGCVQLFVEGEYDAAHDLCERLPSNTSSDYGKPFADLFKNYNYDFFRIDPLLFSPAKVQVTHRPSGHTFCAGAVNLDLLRGSFDY